MACNEYKPRRRPTQRLSVSPSPGGRYVVRAVYDRLRSAYDLVPRSSVSRWRVVRMQSKTQ